MPLQSPIPLPAEGSEGLKSFELAVVGHGFRPGQQLGQLEGRIVNAVLCAPLPLAFFAVRTLLHDLQAPLLFQVCIFVSHFTAPIVRLLGLLRFLRLLRLLRPHFSFVSFSLLSYILPSFGSRGIMERLPC